MKLLDQAPAKIEAVIPGARGGLRILIIDDDAQMRAVLRTILERADHAVLAAETGTQGLAMALQQQPDIIICDVGLPDVSGHMVLKKLHSDYQTRTIPFIFVTGCVEKQSIRRGMAAGAAEYIAKPFRPEDLGEAIAACRRKLAWYDQVLAPLGGRQRCA